MKVNTVSASIMRVSLTDVIAGLSSDEAVAVTKRKDTIAYVLSPEAYEALTANQQEVATEDTSEVEEAPEEPVIDLDKARAEYSTLDTSGEDDYDDDDIFEEDESGDFESYLDNLREQTVSLGFISN
jgi:PHD/YefM family antitoxin component YafN of YafNO toxin-antitoxin module